MAYNAYYPYSYQIPQVQQTVQNSGYMTVRSEEEARNYPMALGNSMTFFNETAPYCYKKTMGFSPLDRPTFERYRIIKEESPEIPQNQPMQTNTRENDKNAEIGQIRAQIDTLSDRIGRLERRYESDFGNVSADDEKPRSILCEDGNPARDNK